MPDKFAQIKQLYSDSFRQHGDSPSSLLTPKGRNNLRFRALDPLLHQQYQSILDYGCGLAYLYKYLLMNDCRFSYTGVDILPEFISACSLKYPNATFLEISALDQITGSFDIVFSSGVFNLRTHDSANKSKDYAFKRIQYLFNLAKEVLVCDFPSTYVDFQQDDAQHFSVSEISEFCYRHLSRRFQIRHDLLPYEFTLIAWKDSKIHRPGNFYMCDQ